MFKDSIGIFQGLIEFIKGLIARKINSSSQFWLQLEEIKVWGSNYKF
jgi:hypothetical protein